MKSVENLVLEAVSVEKKKKRRVPRVKTVMSVASQGRRVAIDRNVAAEAVKVKRQKLIRRNKITLRQKKRLKTITTTTSTVNDRRESGALEQKEAKNCVFNLVKQLKMLPYTHIEKK